MAGRARAGLGVDVLQRRGWYDVPDFWGGPRFEKYILPSINGEARLAHQAGAFHCYLLTMGWAPYLNAFQKLESDILWGADPVASGTTLKTLKERLGRKTLLGGMNSEKQLAQASEPEVRKAVREAVAALAPGGGFVLASSSSIWSEIRWDKIAALIEEGRRVGRYPLDCPHC